MSNPSVLPTNWTEWFALNLPAWFTTGPLGTFTGLTLVTTMDAVAQGMSEAGQAPNQNSPFNPDDALPLIGRQDSLPQYANETNAAYRKRLGSKWSLWSLSTPDTTIVQQLSGAMLPSPTLLFDLGGGGHPEVGILTYPPSQFFWSQEILMFNLPSGSIGTGATGCWRDGVATSSILINNDQLATIRLIFNKFKSTIWAAREIIFIADLTEPIWDDPRLYTWDNSGIVWQGDGPFTTVVERFHA